MQAQNLTGLAARFNDIKEGKYASNLREPLAKGFERNYNWPSDISEHNKENFPFGVPTVSSDSVKDIVNPQKGPIINDPAVQKMYKKTHGNFEPGEQKDREYDWSKNNIDKNTFRFGYQEQIQINGAAKSLHAERSDYSSFPKTVIVRKTVEDVKATQSDLLGKARNLGQGEIPIPRDFAFGARNTSVMGNDVWNASMCIHGKPSERELLPDRDLGRCVKPGSRNVVRRA